MGTNYTSTSNHWITRRLRNVSIHIKLALVGLSGLVIAIVLATLLVTTAIGQFEASVSEVQLAEENILASIRFDQQKSELRELAASLGADVVLGTAIDRGDHASLETIAATYQLLYNLDHIKLVDTDNQALFNQTLNPGDELSQHLEQALSLKWDTAIFLTDEGWLLTATAPVVDPVGAIGAMSIGRLIDDELLDVVNIGRTAPSLNIHGPDGALLASSTVMENGTGPKDQTPPVDLDLWQQAMAGEVGQTIEVVDGIPHRIVYAPLKINDSIAAVYSVDLSTEDIRSLEHQLITQTLLVLIGVGLLIAALLYFLMRRFVTVPLVALSEAAKEIGAGNLEAPLPTAGEDEIGQLTASFGTMVNKLRQSITTLEERVAERTADLTVSNTQLQQEISERIRADGALQEQRAFLRQVVDINPHFIFAKDRSMRFTLANKAFADAYNTTVEGLIGKTDADFNPNSCMVERYDHDDRQVIETGEDLILPKTEVTNIHGEQLWRYTIKRPIRDERGAVNQVLGVATDITYLKEAEEALGKARDQALEASRLKSELLAKVSHELRTPLGAILGYSQLLHLGTFGPVSEEQEEVTAKVIESADYLTELVNELLDQARLESGKLRLNISDVNPVEIVDQVKSKMSVLAQSKGLSLATDIAPDVPRLVSGDEHRLQQILMNLTGNAVKFTETGMVTIKLCCPDSDHWALQVSDTGPGIPPRAQTYVFEPFRQVDGSETRQHEGSGLGLSIVKQLTTLMGGQVTLRSEVGQGSTFTVTLPFTPNQD